MGDPLTVTLEPVAPSARARSPRAALTATAGLASIGAGAIHAAAIGLHVEHRPAALAFTALAVLQIGWGVLACVRSNRLVTVSGVILGLGAVAGFAMAKTTGISFVAGLEAVEPVQTVDALAAALALAAVVLAGVSLLASNEPASTNAPRFATSLAATAVAVVAVFGMVSASTNVHEHSGTGTDHVDAAAAPTGAGDHADGHGDHATTPANGVPAGMATEDPTQPAHKAAAVVPYDPTKPLDFGGTPGVTPEQQAAAENTVAVTLTGLPQWADYRHAEANGFSSIGDGLTGTEHFINQEFMADDIIMDPNRPESLVYDTKRDGTKTLAAAMYMVKQGTPLSEVPNIGGPLMQWHTHGNLCYRPDGKLGGLTNAEGKCAPGLILPVPTPMIHVWIRKHPCGPFAALEGIGGGTIAEGETKLCDTAHGAH